jgi:hypothetical protein
MLNAVVAQQNEHNNGGRQNGVAGTSSSGNGGGGVYTSHNAKTDTTTIYNNITSGRLTGTGSANSSYNNSPINNPHAQRYIFISCFHSVKFKHFLHTNLATNKTKSLPSVTASI